MTSIAGALDLDVGDRIGGEDLARGQVIEGTAEQFGGDVFQTVGPVLLGVRECRLLRPGATKDGILPLAPGREKVAGRQVVAWRKLHCVWGIPEPARGGAPRWPASCYTRH